MKNKLREWARILVFMVPPWAVLPNFMTLDVHGYRIFNAIAALGVVALALALAGLLDEQAKLERELEEIRRVHANGQCEPGSY